MQGRETADERADRSVRRPIRTCAVCRRKAQARELLRVVRAPDGSPVFDWRRNLGGRGAHVCPTRRCIERAVGRHGFDRALKSQIKYPRVESLLQAAREAVSRQVQTLFWAAASSGSLATGTDAARRSLLDGQAVCLVLAEDAGSRSKLAQEAAAAGIGCRTLATKEQIGSMTGRPPTACLAIEDPGLAIALGNALDRLDALQDPSSKVD